MQWKEGLPVQSKSSLIKRKPPKEIVGITIHEGGALALLRPWSHIDSLHSTWWSSLFSNCDGNSKGKKQSTLTVDGPPYWMPVDNAMFWRKVAFVFDKKRLRKNKTTTKPSTINLEKQKTTTIKWSTRKDTGKGKTQKNNQPLTVNTFVLEVVFDEKRLKKHKNNNKTFDNQPWKTKNNNNQMVNVQGRWQRKDTKKTINLWRSTRSFWKSFLMKKD